MFIFSLLAHLNTLFPRITIDTQTYSLTCLLAYLLTLFCPKYLLQGVRRFTYLPTQWVSPQIRRAVSEFFIGQVNMTREETHVRDLAG